MPDMVASWLVSTRTSSSQALARPLPSWGCWSSPYRSSTRMTPTPQLGKTEPCWPVQLGLAVALLADTQSTALQHALVLVIVVLYCSALGRTWEVTGITRRV